MSRFLTVASRAALALVLLAGFAASAQAQSEAGGISTLFAPGARADGMGRAFTAVANDANAIWWNPGGLAFIRGHDISLTYSQLVPDLASDVNWSYPVYAQHVEGWGGLGASVGYLSYGKSEATDVDGNVTGEFTSYELVPSIAYGTELADNVGFGVALKLIRVDLAPQAVTLDQKNGRGTTFAADIGGLIKMPAAKVAIGATLANLGAPRPDRGRRLALPHPRPRARRGRLERRRRIRVQPAHRAPRGLHQRPDRRHHGLHVRPGIELSRRALRLRLDPSVELPGSRQPVLARIPLLRTLRT
jgi:hypothetical protein